MGGVEAGEEVVGNEIEFMSVKISSATSLSSHAIPVYYFPFLFDTRPYSLRTRLSSFRVNNPKLPRWYISHLCSCHGGYPATWKCLPNTTSTSTGGRSFLFSESQRSI